MWVKLFLIFVVFFPTYNLQARSSTCLCQDGVNSSGEKTCSLLVLGQPPFRTVNGECTGTVYKDGEAFKVCDAMYESWWQGFTPKDTRLCEERFLRYEAPASCSKVPPEEEVQIAIMECLLVDTEGNIVAREEGNCYDDRANGSFGGLGGSITTLCGSLKLANPLEFIEGPFSIAVANSDDATPSCEQIMLEEEWKPGDCSKPFLLNLVFSQDLEDAQYYPDRLDGQYNVINIDVTSCEPDAILKTLSAHLDAIKKQCGNCTMTLVNINAHGDLGNDGESPHVTICHGQRINTDIIYNLIFKAFDTNKCEGSSIFSQSCYSFDSFDCKCDFQYPVLTSTACAEKTAKANSWLYQNYELVCAICDTDNDGVLIVEEYRKCAKKLGEATIEGDSYHGSCGLKAECDPKSPILSCKKIDPPQPSGEPFPAPPPGENAEGEPLPEETPPPPPV